MKTCDKRTLRRGISFAVMTVSAAAAIFLSGCAIGYHPLDMSGGYSDEQLTKTEFKVTYDTSIYADFNLTNDLAKLRAAELTLEHQFKYFAIKEKDERVMSSTITVGGNSSTTNGTVNVIGNTAYYQGTTVTNGPTNIPLSSPRVTLRIKCYKEKFDTDALFYDAAVLKAELKKKYGLK